MSGDPAKAVAVGDLSLDPSPGTGGATGIYIFQVLDDAHQWARPHYRIVVKFPGTEPTHPRCKTQRNVT